MAKGYLIAFYRAVHDQDKLAAYAALAGPAMAANGGKFLARSNPAAVYENGMMERTVVVEFDSVEAAISARHSPAYQQAMEALGDTTDRDIRIVEGTE